jgi:hypothetical protein
MTIPRLIFATVAATVCASVLVVYFGGIRPLQLHSAAAKRMDRAIARLADKCPAGLTDDQWAYCIVWTWNLNSNYGHFNFVPTEDLLRIEEELQRRIDAGADVATIDWIWDEYVRAYPRAANYEHFRPTDGRNKADFEAGAHDGYPLSFWRTMYGKLAAQ